MGYRSGEELQNRQQHAKNNTRGSFVAAGNPISPAMPRGTVGQQKRPKAFPRTIGNNINKIVPSNKSLLLLSGNAKRSYLLIQNRGLNNLYIAVGVKMTNPPDYDGGLLIPPGGFYECDTNVFVNDVYAISESGDNRVTIIEGLFVE